MTCYSIGYTGQNFCDAGSRFGKPSAIILAKGTETNTLANFLLEATHNTAINATNIFPLKNMKNFEENSTEAQYFDYPDGSRVLIEQGDYRFSAWFDLNECTKKQLLNFRGFTEALYLVYGDVIRGRTVDSGVNIVPIRINQCNIEKATLPMMDGSPEMVKVTIDLTDERDLNEYDFSREMAWDVYDLDGLTQVTLTEVAGSTTSLITVDVAAVCGGNSNPLSGLGLATTDFAVASATITAIDESATVPGRYAIASSAGFANLDFITLVNPATRTDDVFVIQTGTLQATI